MNTNLRGTHCKGPWAFYGNRFFLILCEVSTASLGASSGALSGAADTNFPCMQYQVEPCKPAIPADLHEPCYCGILLTNPRAKRVVLSRGRFRSATPSGPITPGRHFNKTRSPPTFKLKKCVPSYCSARPNLLLEYARDSGLTALEVIRSQLYGMNMAVVADSL